MDKAKSMRTLFLAKTLYERTDEEHPLSTNELIQILLDEYGISAHRVTVYEDIEQLKASGMDIYTLKSRQNKYYLASRLFDLPELKLLIDAVESSKFITEKKSRVLSEKLTSLASVNQSSELKRNISITGRIKAGNEQIYYIMDALNAAINRGKKVSFLYFEFHAGKRKKLKNEGVPYVLSPYTLTWNGDNYYVVGWSDKHNKIATFRVDRIYHVPEILSENAVPKPKKYNIGEFAEKAFQLYDSEHTEVELVCENAMMRTVLDHFGAKIKPKQIDEDHFSFIAEVSLSPTFFAWIFEFGGRIRICGPQNAIDAYRELLEKSFQSIEAT